MRWSFSPSVQVFGLIGVLSVAGLVVQGQLFRGITKSGQPVMPVTTASGLPPQATQPSPAVGNVARAFGPPPVKAAPVAPPVTPPPDRSFPADIRLMGVIMDSDGRLEVVMIEQAGQVRRLGGGEHIGEWRLSEIGPREAVFTRGNERHRLELVWDVKVSTAQGQPTAPPGSFAPFSPPPPGFGPPGLPRP
jgi:hypothetical protein